jgi:hypothetical protein
LLDGCSAKGDTQHVLKVKRYIPPMSVITHAASIAPRQTSWTGTLDLAQMDSTLGLHSLTLSLTGMLVSTAVVVNQGFAPAAFGSIAKGSITLERPDGTGRLTATPSAALSAIRCLVALVEVDTPG